MLGEARLKSAWRVNFPAGQPEGLPGAPVDLILGLMCLRIEGAMGIRDGGSVPHQSAWVIAAPSAPTWLPGEAFDAQALESAHFTPQNHPPWQKWV